MRKINQGMIRIFVVILLVAGTGCASTGSAPNAGDPFESVNRSIFEFNLTSDRIFLKPIARGYSRVVPAPVRTGVNNFFNNLWEPWTVVNDLLQGKIYLAARDATRFIFNSTFGILGIFDVATHMDLPRRREDFGQTLGYWGVPPGPYLILPFLGPSNLRDTTGLVPQYLYGDVAFNFGSPESYYVASFRLVDTRAQLLGTDDILDLQPDTYLFLREGYRQQRINLIHDGNPRAGQTLADRRSR
jgi:phospholipid-binding lipoprotein MlaA